MDPQNLATEVYLVCLLAWLLVLGAAIWSIFGKEDRSVVVKLVWTAVVVALPLVGVLLYALYSLSHIEMMLFQGSPSTKKPRQKRAVLGSSKEMADADAVV